jgi:hypothetical protein
MKTVKEMFEYVESVVKETGKLPSQKEFIIGGECFKFYRVIKKVDKKQYYYTCNTDDSLCDFAKVETNKKYGKNYIQILYYHNYLDIVNTVPYVKQSTRVYID